MNIFKSVFHLPKKGASQPKISAPAPEQILNRLQLKNHHLWLRNTDRKGKFSKPKNAGV